MKIWNKYSRIVRKLTNIGAALGMVLLAIMSLLVTTEVVCRSVFGVSTLIADEYACYLCVGLAFLGAAYAFGQGNFINVDILYAKFSPKVKKWVDLVLYLMILAFLIYLLSRCIYVVKYSLMNHVLSSGLSRTPLYIPQLTMVIGSGIFLLQMTVSIGELFIPSGKNDTSTPEKKEVDGV